MYVYSIICMISKTKKTGGKRCQASTFYMKWYKVYCEKARIYMVILKATTEKN